MPDIILGHLRVIYDADAQKLKAVSIEASQVVKNMAADFDRQSKKAKTSFAGMIEGAGKLAVGLNQALELFKKFGRVAAEAMELAYDAAKFEQMRESFIWLAGGSEEAADRMMAALRQASRGTISDMDLMQAASRAMTLGLTRDTGELARLMEIARLRARAMGVDMTQAYNDITLGISRKSKLILDNLGFIVDLDDAYKDYARTLGVASGALTASQQQHALLQVVLKQGGAELKSFGEMALTDAEKLSQLRAVGENLRIELGQKLLPIFMKDFVPLLERLATEVGPPLIQTIVDIADELGPLVKVLGEELLKIAPDVLEFLGEDIPRALETLKQLIVIVTASWAGIIELFKSGDIEKARQVAGQTFLDLAKRLELIGKSAEKAKKPLRDLADDTEDTAKDMLKSLAEVTAEWKERHQEMLKASKERKEKTKDVLGEIAEDHAKHVEAVGKLNDDFRRDEEREWQEHGVERLRMEQDQNLEVERAREDHHDRLVDIAEDARQARRQADKELAEAVKAEDGKLGEDLKAIDAKYYADLEKQKQDHQDRMKALDEKFFEDARDLMEEYRQIVGVGYAPAEDAMREARGEEPVARMGIDILLPGWQDERAQEIRQVLDSIKDEWQQRRETLAEEQEQWLEQRKATWEAEQGAARVAHQEAIDALKARHTQEIDEIKAQAKLKVAEEKAAFKQTMARKEEDFDIELARYDEHYKTMADRRQEDHDEALRQLDKAHDENITKLGEKLAEEAKVGKEGAQEVASAMTEELNRIGEGTVEQIGKVVEDSLKRIREMAAEAKRIAADARAATAGLRAAGLSAMDTAAGGAERVYPWPTQGPEMPVTFAAAGGGAPPPGGGTFDPGAVRRQVEEYFGKGWGQGGIPSGLVTPDTGAIQQQIREAIRSHVPSQGAASREVAEALQRASLNLQLDQNQDIKVYLDGEDITSRVQVDVYSRLIRKAIGQ